MPNIARLLKEEIVRVARKEFRSEAESLKQSSLRYRSEIAALKRQVATLEREVARRAAVILAVLWGCVFASPALATGFHDFSVDPARHRVALYLRDAHGQILGDFDALNRYLAARGERLVFAMNAGIFMEDRRPLGLYVENGKRQRPLIVAKSGYGNFYMQPNGVFAITAAGPLIVPTDRWWDAARAQPVLFATQSGPLPLIDGQINPLFAKHSRARLIRNGVCTTPSSQLWLSISRVPVTFREFAEHQRSLGCRQGLYMDGSISGAFSAEASLAPGRPPFGPLIGVTSINGR